MRQARFLHGGLLFLLAFSFGSAGCTHNYYYGAVPACPPGTPGAVTYGSVCEVPPSSGGTVVAQGSAGARPSVVGTAPRVVVSEPSGSRFPWRRSDPEGIATTRVEGALDESTTR